MKSAGDPALALPAGFWHLATCLRSIVFTEQESVPVSLQQYEMLRGERAYEFLLQVICGLDSPLMGETEILGQFKQFFKRHRGEFTVQVQEMVDSLNRDAKKIRAQFLQNLGCTSYGSLLRKEIRGQKRDLVVLGAGSLAQDILPWFAKTENKIRVYTRSPEKYDELFQSQNNLTSHALADLGQTAAGGVLILAAPVDGQWLSEQVDLKLFEQIYDLRGNSHVDKLPVSRVTTLQSLFANIESNKVRAHKTRESAVSAIKQKAALLSVLERPRPFGWEDLWAYS